MKKTYTKASVCVIRCLDFIRTSGEKAGTMEIKLTDDWAD